MIEWHVLDPSQELVSSNGAAILCVARELVSAAKERGISAFIVGGSRSPADLSEAMPVLNQDHFRQPGIRWLLERSSKFLLGRSLAPALSFSGEYGATPDRVVLHNLPWAGSTMRKRFPNAHLVLYVHNKILGGLPPFSLRRTLSTFNEIVCVSDFVRKELENRCRFSAGKSPTFRAVHHAVRTDLSFAADRSEYDVVYVGRLVPEKGVHILTEAAALPGRSWNIAVVGGKYFVPGADEDPYVLELHRQSALNNLKIEFTGPVSPKTVADFLSKARVAVVTSIWDEPAGLTLLEAMASPAAVVASKVGGMPEMSREGGVVFVPPANAPALRAAIDELLADESKRNVIASKGRQEVARRTWRHVYDDFATI